MTEPGQRIVVVDLRIPFLRLVLFFVKAALAAIPAAIIVGLVLMVVTAIIAALAGNHGTFMMWRQSL
jgi:VIT1/CCC1 family predicted Fe2+/Mn2+ transporter